jgi:tripartite-type tricarboxylate transporter receptor subunit TctC
MNLRRRHLAAALAFGALSVLGSAAAADTYPSRPIRLIVGFPPGGGTDIVARYLAHELTKSLGQGVVVENKGGANGVIGTQDLAKSAPDGYTLMMTISSHVTNALLYPKLNYNTLKDFAPISIVASSPFVLIAHPEFKPNTISELIALAKAQPNQINYGTPGNGSTQHLSHELMNLMGGMKMTHVPYKGGAPALQDMLSGRISPMFLTTVQALPYLKQNRAKALGVSSKNKTAVLPNVPPIGETIPGYESDVWFGLIAPAGTPKPIIKKLSEEVARIVRSPEMSEKLAAQGAEPIGNTPEQFAQVITSEYAKWSDVFKKTGIKAE